MQSCRKRWTTARGYEGSDRKNDENCEAPRMEGQSVGVGAKRGDEMKWKWKWKNISIVCVLVEHDFSILSFLSGIVLVTR